jgi:membrane-associated phospholipid phosphatase
MGPQHHATARPPGAERRKQPRGRFNVARSALYSTLRFIARHVRGFWAAIIAFLGLGLAAGAAATAVFAARARTVEKGVTAAMDARVVEWFASHRQPWLDVVMLEITTLGNGLVLTMIVTIVSAFLWLTNHRWSVYLLLVGVLGGQIINNMLKGAFGRERPSVVEWVDHVSTSSFPSGHAMSAIIAYGSVAYLVGRLEPTPALRRTTWVFAALIILGIGISRMYLGVHYPSDILAGFIAGLAWLAFVAASVTAVQFFAPRRPETAAEERGLDELPEAPDARRA